MDSDDSDASPPLSPPFGQPRKRPSPRQIFSPVELRHHCPPPSSFAPPSATEIQQHPLLNFAAQAPTPQFSVGSSSGGGRRSSPRQIFSPVVLRHHCPPPSGFAPRSATAIQQHPQLNFAAQAPSVGSSSGGGSRASPRQFFSPAVLRHHCPPPSGLGPPSATAILHHSLLDITAQVLTAIQQHPLLNFGAQPPTPQFSVGGRRSSPVANPDSGWSSGSLYKPNDPPPVPGEPEAVLTPHIITINRGEDIASRLMAFSQSQQGTRRVCILSANGAVSSVSLRQYDITITHEGIYYITKLQCSPPAGSDVGIGALTLIMAGQDGRIIGGEVTGVLIAASPVQVVMGSSIATPPLNWLSLGT